MSVPAPPAKTELSVLTVRTSTLVNVLKVTGFLLAALPVFPALVIGFK